MSVYELFSVLHGKIRDYVETEYPGFLVSSIESGVRTVFSPLGSQYVPDAIAFEVKARHLETSLRCTVAVLPDGTLTTKSREWHLGYAL